MQSQKSRPKNEKSKELPKKSPPTPKFSDLVIKIEKRKRKCAK